MSKNWFLDQRQRYIEWRLVNYGSICGADIARTFGVSVSQGTIDIQAFSAARPNALRYDPKAKANVVARGHLRSRLAPGQPLTVTIAEPPEVETVTFRDRIT